MHQLVGAEAVSGGQSQPTYVADASLKVSQAFHYIETKWHKNDSAYFDLGVNRLNVILKVVLDTESLEAELALVGPNVEVHCVFMLLQAVLVVE